MKKEDLRLLLNNSSEQIKVKPYFLRYKDMIETNGFIEVMENNETAKVYNPYLLEILSDEELPVINAETRENITINGTVYISTYIQGFIAGEKWFNQKFGGSIDTLYGPKAGEYVNDIHDHYFHIKNKGGYFGWKSVKTSYPMLFDHATIRKLGHYSGIVNQVEEMIKSHPALFKDFYLHEDKRLQKKPFLKNELSLRAIALITVHKGEFITREKGKVYSYFTLYSNKPGRIAIEVTRKKTENKIKLFEKIIPYLPEAKQKTVIDEVNTLKAALEKETF